MPRDAGTGVYHYPDGTPGNPGQTIFSTRYNTFINDLSVTLNQPLPISVGGTGGANEIEARDKLNVEVSGAEVLDYDTHVFEWGSFYSRTSATNSPIGGHGFVGIAYGYDPSYLVIEARDIQVASSNLLFVRRKIGGVWEAWTSAVVTAGDITVDKSFPAITLDKAAAGEFTAIYGSVNGVKRWVMSLGNADVETGGNTGSNFVLNAYDDAGVAFAMPSFRILRSDSTVQISGPTTVIGPFSTTGGNINVNTTNAVATIFFSSAAGKTLTYDGTNFHLAGGHFVIDGGFGVNAANGVFGGTLSVTGNATLGGTCFIAGQAGCKTSMFIDAFSAGTDPSLILRDSTTATKGGLFWDHTLDEVKVTHSSGNVIRIGTWGIESSNTNAYKPAGGPWLVSSDARIKTVVGDYQHGLDEVLALRPVIYSYKGNDTRSETEVSTHAGVIDKHFVGLIAQEVEPVMPEMVASVPGYIDGKAVTDMRVMDTNALIYALVNAVKVLTARIEVLEAAQAPP